MRQLQPLGKHKRIQVVVYFCLGFSALLFQNCKLATQANPYSQDKQAPIDQVSGAIDLGSGGSANNGVGNGVGANNSNRTSIPQTPPAKKEVSDRPKSKRKSQMLGPANPAFSANNSGVGAIANPTENSTQLSSALLNTNSTNSCSTHLAKLGWAGWGKAQWFTFESNLRLDLFPIASKQSTGFKYKGLEFSFRGPRNSSVPRTERYEATEDISTTGLVLKLQDLDSSKSVTIPLQGFLAQGVFFLNFSAASTVKLSVSREQYLELIKDMDVVRADLFCESTLVARALQDLQYVEPRMLEVAGSKATTLLTLQCSNQAAIGKGSAKIKCETLLKRTEDLRELYYEVDGRRQSEFDGLLNFNIVDPAQGLHTIQGFAIFNDGTKISSSLLTAYGSKGAGCSKEFAVSGCQ